MFAHVPLRDDPRPRRHALELCGLGRDDLEALAVFKLWTEVGVKSAVADVIVASMNERSLFELLESPLHSVGAEFMDRGLLDKAHAFRGRVSILKSVRSA